MKREAIYGKVLALTKEIYLQRREGDDYFRSAFLIPAGPLARARYPFGTEWWTSLRTDLLCLDISQAAQQTVPTLSHGDETTFKRLLLETIRENLLDGSLFDFNKFFPPKVATLFECIAPTNKVAFATEIFERFARRCEGAMRDWLVAYPTVGINAPTFSLGHDGLSLIASNDASTWKQFGSVFPDAEMFDLRTSTWFMDSGSAPFLPKKPATWLLCSLRGTADGARLAAGKRMRTFISVVFSLGYEHHTHLFAHSGADVTSYSVQFAGKVGNPPSNSLAAIGMMTPPLLNDWAVEEPVLKKTLEWYTKRAQSDESLRNRANTSAQFFHFGLIADDIERFIHLFIALDALFGERGKVETSILNGVDALFLNDSEWKQKTQMLFDLRSEIVHGECSDILAWSSLENYTRRFRSAVLPDVIHLASTALVNYFGLPRSAPTKRWYTPVTHLAARRMFQAAGWLNRV